MKSLIASAALAAALLYAVPAAWAQDTTGMEFVKEAIQGNLAEVQMGKLAKQKGASEGVRSYGAQLEREHSSANRKALDVARKMKLKPPTEPNTKQKDAYAHLAKLSGAEFDREFVEHMIDDHKKDIDAYEKEAKSSNAAVAKYASESLPTLRKHLELAQSLSNKATTGSR
jgi:putative membrane protein